MNARRPITAIGAGITVFLVVAVAVIELIAFEFSALIGLPVGLLAGIAVAVVIFVKYDDVSAVLQWWPQPSPDSGMVSSRPSERAT